MQKVDLKAKEKENEAEQQRALKVKLAKLQQEQRKMCAQRSAAKSPQKITTTMKHGGVVQAFKAPAQTGPSGVEYFERDGENFTTLKQLQSAIMKKRTTLGKRKAV